MPDLDQVDLSVILVEDDPLIRESFTRFLSRNGFSVAGVENALAFYEQITNCSFDIAIIDLALPDQDGHVLIEYACRNTQMGVVVLTSHDTADRRISCYEAGADLFFGKPVNGSELVAAIEGLMRRRGAKKSRPLSRQSQTSPHYWKLDLLRRKLVTPVGSLVKLTGKESQLLEILTRAQGETVSRDIIEDSLYPRYGISRRHALDTLVRRVRQKIRTFERSEDFILTEHGIGYRLTEPVYVTQNSP
jgi:DNA-binding response OmpR family regulator